MNRIHKDTFAQPEKMNLRELISDWFVKGDGNFLDFYGNGDMVRHLFLDKKIDTSRIYAVEHNKRRAKKMLSFPKINKYFGTVRNYAAIASERGITFRCAWLDYCGPISREMIGDAAAIMPTVDMGGMMILTLLAARERHRQAQGHEAREIAYPIHVLDAAVNSKLKFELQFKAFYSGKHKQTTMLVLGFKRIKTASAYVQKVMAMPSVLTAGDTNGLRVVGTFGK